MKYTESAEMYLKEIYILSLKNPRIRATDVAKALNVNKSSVCRAVNLLCREGLLSHATYGLIELTEQGAQKAHGIYQKQNIIAAYLMTALDLESQMAMEEACKLEHVLGAAVILKMKQKTISYKSMKDAEELR